jgi:hypothetical protein
MSDRKTCKDCCWWQRYDHAPEWQPTEEELAAFNGECRVNPPVYVSSTASGFPHADRNSWCSALRPGVELVNPPDDQEAP